MKSRLIPLPFVLLILFSGMVALAYQILWMRQLGLIFGNSAHAAAMTLGVFFAGLAAGSWFWGERSTRQRKPLRTYAGLEAGIGGAGLLCLIILELYFSIYPALYGQFSDGGIWLVKGLLAFFLVFPPAFLMGGTLPVLGRSLIREQAAFGVTTAAMLGVNTVGAAAGAFAAAFLFLPSLGFRLTCIVAVVTSFGVALYSLVLSRREMPPEALPRSLKKKKGVKKKATAADSPGVPRWAIRLLAFVSGFSVLALEVLWTRMLAQVHENSVYSFAAVLIVVLLCLAGGAGMSSWLAARSRGAVLMLQWITAAGGLAVLIVPLSFMQLTNGLQMLPEPGTFWLYVVRLFATTLGAIGPSCLVLGMLFPFLMKGEQRYTTQPGRSIGMLTAINTTGAILGPLICGFFLLEWLGIWMSMVGLAALYCFMALVLPPYRKAASILMKAGTVFLLFSAFTWLSPKDLPVTGLDPDQGRQQVIETWEASDSTVTVVRKQNGEYAIRINSNYSLGSSEAYMSQIYQTRVPLLAWPDRRSLFYLGLGTGITAGEALDRRDFPEVERVVVTELSPSVAEAAYRYFGGAPGSPDLCNGLFTDPRAEVMVRDGRNVLMATEDRYDMINADLFLPYRSGAGSLYSLEHFQTVYARLNPGGVFVQWLPLYQLSEREFGIIARTLLEVFEEVTMWRCHFQPGADTVALIGHREGAPVPASSLDTTDQQRSAVLGRSAAEVMRLALPINTRTIPFFYCGNLSGIRSDFEDYPLNTDDKPVIEYGTPRSLHRMVDGRHPHFIGEPFADLVDRVLEATPPEDDPVLALRPPEDHHLPRAGAAYYRAGMALQERDPQALERYWQAFRRHWLEAAGGERR